MLGTFPMSSPLVTATQLQACDCHLCSILYGPDTSRAFNIKYKEPRVSPIPKGTRWMDQTPDLLTAEHTEQEEP